MSQPAAALRLHRGLIWVSAFALLVFTAFPLAWMASTAFKSSQEIFITPPTLIPRDFTLDNIARLFEETRFLTYFRNSITVSLSTVAITLLLSTPAAYSLTRFRFVGREKIAGLILFTYMFAPIMIIIPFYVMIRWLGLANTHFGLILAYTAFCLPFNLWLLRTFFQTIPTDIEDAALIDGANRFQSVLYVILPLALPGIIATGIFTFILAWNDYIFARVLISSDELKTLPVGIADLYNASVVDWGMIMAAGLLVIVPIVGVFVFIQRYLIAGLGSRRRQGVTASNAPAVTSWLSLRVARTALTQSLTTGGSRLTTVPPSALREVASAARATLRGLQIGAPKGAAALSSLIESGMLKGPDRGLNAMWLLSANLKDWARRTRRRTRDCLAASDPRTPWYARCSRLMGPNVVQNEFV